MKKSTKERRAMSPQALQLVAARFKVLSDPTRLRILQLLMDGETSVSTIAEAVQSTQPNVSKHLKTLQDAGLVSRRQDGNTAFYSIADQTVFELCEIVCSSLEERFIAHAEAFTAKPPHPAARRPRLS